jgi:signal transduction histidine kinase
MRLRVAELTETNRALTEAVEARDTLLAIAGHELRNPMTPILGRVDMLRRLIGKADFPREKVSDGLEHLEWLVGRFVGRATMLLDVSRITSNRLELSWDPVDVGVLAHQVAENFRPLAVATGADLAVEIDADQTVIIGDANALEIIMDNLVSMISIHRCLNTPSQSAASTSG